VISIKNKIATWNIMEKKLAEYRARKKTKVEKDNSSAKSNKEPQMEAAKLPPKNDDLEEKNETFESFTEDSFDQETECGYVTRIFRKLYTINFLMKFALWLSLQVFFIEIQFGAAYFVISLCFVMYFSMKANQRKAHEPSAYSVFNKDCEEIDGTFNAQQFERQMIYGGAIR